MKLNDCAAADDSTDDCDDDEVLKFYNSLPAVLTNDCQLSTAIKKALFLCTALKMHLSHA